MSKKTRVLFIAGRVSTRNGAFHSLLSNVKEFKNTDIEPIVLIHQHGETEEELKNAGIQYRIVRFESCTVPADEPSRLKGAVKSIINSIQEWKVRKIINEENIEIVHINVSTTSIGAKSALALGKPLVWHAREFLEEDVNLTYINPKKTKELLQKANTMVAISDAVANHFRTQYQIKRIVTVYNGIYFDSILPVKRFSKDKDVTHLAIVGRIVPTKGQLEAIKALRIVREKGMNAVLTVVGDSGNNIYYETIKEYIQRNNLESYVFMMSHKGDLHPVWEETDIALVCSTKEGFGRVTAEFMLNGIPVIGANTGATPELLEENRGYLYEYGNEHHLAAQIMEAIENTEKTYEIAKNAQNYAKNNFTSNHCAEEIVNLYRGLVNKSDRRE